MKHQFLAPVSIRHLALGAWLVGVGRGLVVFALMAAIGSSAFGFDFLGAGPASLAAFLLGCFLSSLIIGLFVCALVILFGTRAESSAWAAVNFLVMLAGIYYPVSVLPGWAQTVSAADPAHLLPRRVPRRLRLRARLRPSRPHGLRPVRPLPGARALGARRRPHAVAPHRPSPQALGVTP